jgi:hypothetical protein
MRSKHKKKKKEERNTFVNIYICVCETLSLAFACCFFDSISICVFFNAGHG